jgi:glycosyltransferase involved in cell wall biosynthesis
MDGFMMQKTAFPYEALIHEDASTDKTADIIREYEAQYPDIIKPIYQAENQYSKGIRISVTYQFPRAKGKYIALCEGDDYWTDPDKLQKQIDFLEAHPDYNLCSHLYKLYDQAADKWELSPAHISFKDNDLDGITFDKESNFSTSWFTQTMTIVFRKDALDCSVLGKYKYLRDTHIYYHLLKAGKGYCMNFEGAVYRLHQGGIYSKMAASSKNLINYKIFSELYYYNREDEMLKDNYLFLRNLVLNALRDSIREKKFTKELRKELSSFIKNEHWMNGLKILPYCVSRMFLALFESPQK